NPRRRHSGAPPERASRRARRRGGVGARHRTDLRARHAVRRARRARPSRRTRLRGERADGPAAGVLCPPAGRDARRAGRGRMTSVRRNVAWALAGNLGYAACQWAVFVAVARLGGAADAGRLALGLALTAPVIVLANLQLRAVQATDARGEQPFAVSLGLRLVTTAAALVAIAALALGLGYRGATLGVILGCALAKSFETLSDLVFGLLQHAEDLRRVALSMLGKGIAS